MLNWFEIDGTFLNNGKSQVFVTMYALKTYLSPNQISFILKRNNLLATGKNKTIVNSGNAKPYYIVSTETNIKKNLSELKVTPHNTPPILQQRNSAIRLAEGGAVSVSRGYKEKPQKSTEPDGFHAVLAPKKSVEKDSPTTNDNRAAQGIVSDVFKSADITTKSTTSLKSKKKISHQCEYCQKTFNRKCNLTKHLRIHTGEKPYECEHCLKAFRQAGTLKRHRLIHTDEMPYQCEHCLKAFREASQLNTHLRIHNGEKPYECKRCLTSFRQTAHIKSHLKRKKKCVRQVQLSVNEGLKSIGRCPLEANSKSCLASTGLPIDLSKLTEN